MGKGANSGSQYDQYLVDFVQGLIDLAEREEMVDEDIAIYFNVSTNAIRGYRQGKSMPDPDKIQMAVELLASDIHDQTAVEALHDRHCGSIQKTEGDE